MARLQVPTPKMACKTDEMWNLQLKLLRSSALRIHWTLELKANIMATWPLFHSSEEIGKSATK